MTAAVPARVAGSTLRIAVLGDIHDYRTFIWPWELLGKPLAGQVNLWFNRRKRFDRSLIAPTIARAITSRPDRALFSGDLTTTSRPREFRSIAAALAPLVDACAGDAVIVAGNHDRYTFSAQRTRRIEKHFAGRTPEVFPSVRPLVGGWRLIAVDSSVPRLLDSRGRIGGRQLQHVQSLLASMDDDDGAVILCHYPMGKPPLLPPMHDGHRLLDEREWREVISSSRARIVLVHGHVHCPWVWKPDGMPRVLDINAGAPTMISPGWERGKGFWTIDLRDRPVDGITLTHHVMTSGEQPVGFATPAQQDDADPAWTMRTGSIAW